MGDVRGRQKNLMSQFLSDDQGQATVEYILILSFAAVVSVALAKVILGSVDSGITRVGGQLEKDMKTGRISTSVWNN